MKIDHCGMTDVGRKREKNEDSFLINEKLGLFVVADGMGGHLGGECASRLAVTTLEEILRQVEEDPDATVMGDQPINLGDFSDRLKYGIRVASSRIFEEAMRNPSLRGMGTTSVVLLVQGEKGYVANVGDSRAYLIRAGTIRQITSDHSLVNEQIQAGFISKKDARHHRLKNIITRSVGFQEEVETDVQVHELQPADCILLCSDGLTNLIEDREILRIVGRCTSSRTACERLIEAANKKGGDDNITTIIVRFEGEPDLSRVTLPKKA